ncbi:broad specificity phosphatase PhoE [Litorivivens lipolytica]|uniref:Broad specificity phosphatase PhoE n=1 Tax=Litorivivens lipolytica TaxID=1524264 RepID=A0A7W4Z6P5_9GAMM|nr:histidine phosphatase family protein [Litorivivens lipolytica]MBB3048513.1 broad specificity phosphatase PhoE [Litorivivens lipolytica]
MAEILMVRHGQASFGTDNYDRLSELGWEQARILGEHFAATEPAFDAVFTGTLRRHRETLAGIQQVLPELPAPNELPGLNEFDFHALVSAYRSQHLNSDVEVSDARAFYGCLREALLAWSRDELSDLNENWGGFETRVRGTLEEISALRGRVLVVSSGGPISAVVREVLSLGVEQMVNLNLQAINTGITRYYGNREHWRLNMFNAVPHLEPAPHRHLITYT